jgi:hypothetical protein
MLHGSGRPLALKRQAQEDDYHLIGLVFFGFLSRPLWNPTKKPPTDWVGGLKELLFTLEE